MQLEEIAVRLVHPGHTVLDVGAHEGNTAIPFAVCVRAQGRVYAFEANPIYFLTLAIRAATEKPGIVIPYCKAIATSTEHLTLYSTADLANPNYKQASTIVASEASESRLGKNFLKFSIEAETLDHFCAEKNITPQFIKIDVEGAEDQVLRGAQKTLLTTLPYVYYECGWTAGTSAVYHHELLEALGYKLYVADVLHYAGRWSSEDARLAMPALLPITFAELLTIPTILVNILAIPASRLDETGERVKLGTTRFLDMLHALE